MPSATRSRPTITALPVHRPPCGDASRHHATRIRTACGARCCCIRANSTGESRERCDRPRHQCVSRRRLGGACCATASLSPPSRKSASVASSTVAGLSARSDPGVPRDGRSAADATSTMSRSRESARAPLAQGLRSRSRIGRRASGPRSRGATSQVASVSCRRPWHRRSVSTGDDRPRIALGRASSGAPGERVLRLAVRRGGGLRDRRLRRLRQHVVGASAAASRSTSSHRTFFPHSLGLLYLAVTQFLGFTSYGDEFKVMGLAPYGAPRLRATRFAQLVTSAADGGSSSSTSSYFRHWSDGVEHDVGRRRADDRPRVHATKLEAAARPGAPAGRAARRARHEAIARVAAGGLRGCGVPRAQRAARSDRADARSAWPAAAR